MGNLKKSLKMILASMLTLSILAACADSTSQEQTTTAGNTETTTAAEGDSATAADDTEEAVTTQKEVIEKDLGGIEIILGNWWANSDDFNPSTTYEEELVAYRQWIQDTYNCTIKEVNLCGWDQMQEKAGASIMAGNPEASVFVLDSSWVAALLKNGLFYPVSECPSIDFEDEKWNKFVKEVMTYNGKTYGFATDFESRVGVFFNKRLLEEAGINPDAPYDHQKDGTWTWAVFEDMCKKTTRDIDNDGIIDTYALATFSIEYMNGIIYSNNAQYVGKKDGLFYNGTTTPEFLEACQFAQKLQIEGYIMPKPDEGLNWDWFKAAFHDGQAAFRVEEEYAKEQLETMADDWGFVLFPAGPSGQLTPTYRENVLVVPSTFSAEEADAIMFAYSLWSDPVPGYEDEETWRISAYPKYRDERAVDETLAIMRSGVNGTLEYHAYVAGFAAGDIAYNIWNTDKTPAELIEGVQNSYNQIITDMNEMMASRLG